MSDQDYAPDEASDSIATEERTFRNSDEYHFLGHQLEPFSFLRQTALFGLIDQLGSSVMAEVGAALWLMHQPDEKVRKVRRNPAVYVAEIDAWAQEQAITVNGPALVAATAVYQEIMADVRASATTPDLPKTGGGNPDPK